MSVRDFAKAQDDELAPVDSDEAYIAVAKAMGYDVLGCAPDADVADFREDMGTLEQRRWDKLERSAPADETTPCWWLMNPMEEKTNAPRLLSRSLVCLRLELSATRLLGAPRAASSAWSGRNASQTTLVRSVHCKPRGVFGTGWMDQIPTT